VITLVRLLLRLLLSAALGTGSAAFAFEPAAVRTERPVVLSDPTGQVELTEGIDVMFEPAGSEPLTLEAALALPQSAWSTHPRGPINFSWEHRGFWLRFTLRSATHVERWMLGVPWPSLNQVTFYAVDPATGQLIDARWSGSDLPRAQKDFGDAGYSFELPLSPGAEVTVLMRVTTANVLFVPIQVAPAKVHHAREFSHAVMLGLLFGALAAMLLYNTALYVLTRDLSYAYYMAYLLAILLYELSVTGLGVVYVWGQNAWLNERGYALFAALPFVFATLFFREFVRLKDGRGRAMQRQNAALAGIWIVLAVIAAVWPGPLLHRVMVATAMLTLCAAIYTSLRLARRGNTAAGYFAMAWGVVLVATLGMMLAVSGLIEFSETLQNVQHAGFLVETVLISVALAARIKQEKSQRIEAQRETRDVTRQLEDERDEKLRMQELALQVEREAKRELEARVAERTQALQDVMLEVEAANRELARISITDSLTQTFNRRHFDTELGREVARADRHGSALSLLIIDIDYFKTINDRYGHPVGDAALKHVADLLKATAARISDVVSRYGGEEFTVILPGTTAEQAFDVAERLRARIEASSFLVEGARVPMTVSVGLAERTRHTPRTAQAMVSAADVALYLAKQAGRNRVMLALSTAAGPRALTAVK
jgi:diguanylate cyclase (GGDEF)-like protein